MSKNNQAKFFCENCGSEVPENAKLCKKCGKFFISVRCPNCGAMGTSKEFKDGCPKCGYAEHKQNDYSGASISDKAKALNAILAGAKNQSKKRYSSRASTRASDSLPSWIYIITAILMISVMIGIYSCLKA